MSLKGKVAVVTGVANPKGIAYGSAKVLGREGAKLAIVDVSDMVFERAMELKEVGYKVSAFRADLTNSSEVSEFVKKVLVEYGKIDILVNVAGGGRPFMEERQGSWVKDFTVLTEEDYDYVVDINLKTTFHSIKAVLPGMLKQRYGKIVNIASVTGPLVCEPTGSGYTTAKAAICGLTKTLALEVAAYDITVNAILPGWVYTGLGGAGEHGEPGTVKRKAFNASIPMKYLGRAEQAGDLVRFLVSDESEYITGLEVVFDGGNIIQEMKIGPAYPQHIESRESKLT
jgi:3-oxoacyl-[acyl-carrier protein] reductase